MENVNRVFFFVESDKISGFFDLSKNDSKLARFFKIKIENSKNELLITIRTVVDLNIKRASTHYYFDQKISQCRDSSYKWSKMRPRHIFSAFSNKILKLSNGDIITGKFLSCVWEARQFTKPKIIDHLINPECTPIFFQNDNYRVFQKKFLITKETQFQSGILKSRRSVEWSRSQKGFLPIFVFTDHCDFDTVEKLILIRNILNKNKIKVTRCFFSANDIDRLKSKGADYIAKELFRWKREGHELAFHTHLRVLSDEINIENFDQFLKYMPFKTNIWIDHGIAKYNFSMQTNGAKKTSG